MTNNSPKRLTAVSHKKENQSEPITLFLSLPHPLHHSTILDSLPSWYHSASYRVENSPALQLLIQRSQVRTLYTIKEVYGASSLSTIFTNISTYDKL